jgi:hypothetical protein
VRWSAYQLAARQRNGMKARTSVPAEGVIEIEFTQEG